MCRQVGMFTYCLLLLSDADADLNADCWCAAGIRPSSLLLPMLFDALYGAKEFESIMLTLTFLMIEI